MTPSSVEKHALETSGYQLKYSPSEKIGVIEVRNFPHLGKLAALRFLEWSLKNPEGVISLPTGKTPEFFIKEVKRILNGWSEKSVLAEVEAEGLPISRKPDLSKLQFVQIDDFYPINPKQHNSFYHYVSSYYIDSFGLSRKRALLIDTSRVGVPKSKTLYDVWNDKAVDLSLRYRQPINRQERLQKSVLQNLDQWCVEYEDRIRQLGGIGFFLGGIGPDGHIGFNIRGSDLYSTTRLTPTNYETQAASASDLGGIEVAQKRLVITIGLETITHNRDCVALIIAAGEAKAGIVASAIQQEPHIQYPASALQKLSNARFYITHGAAKYLAERRLVDIESMENVDAELAEKILVDISLKEGKKLDILTRREIEDDRFGKLLLNKKSESYRELLSSTRKRLEERIDRGMSVEKNKVYLHTEPHHDDVMLGYLPHLVRHIREHGNEHHFATLTSGFTAVTNDFITDLLKRLRSGLDRGSFDQLFKEGYFAEGNESGRNRDVWQYLDGVAAHSRTMKDEGRLRRLIRNILFLYDLRDLEEVRAKTRELIAYFKEQYPGKKDVEDVQRLKGMCREWEADTLWGYFGWNSSHIHHLRLGFYKGDIFTEDPTIERDVLPILNVLRQVKPDVVSLALDPEASGPDTHYKVLQAMTEALKLYEKETGRSDIEVLGYRNVWYRYHPSEASMFVPVSLNMFALQDVSFINAFISQRDASFPSYEHDGPFSELAQRIQVEQYQMLKTCLGREFFNEHASALMRATRGMVYLKCLSLEELYQHSRTLRQSTEDR
ncbi:MAG: glucosamine-6-phosphate deaminase [Calditrichia bacterium]